VQGTHFFPLLTSEKKCPHYRHCAWISLSSSYVLTKIKPVYSSSVEPDEEEVLLFLLVTLALVVLFSALKTVFLSVLRRLIFVWRPRY
jgi:hypothetical protein